MIERKRFGSCFLMSKIIIALLIGAVVLMGAVGGYFTVALVSPVSQSKPALFVINKGEGSREIASSLARAGIVRNAAVFLMYAYLSGKSERMQAGTYEFSFPITPLDVLNDLVQGRTQTEIKVTFPEGVTVDDIAQLLAANHIVTSASDFSDYHFTAADIQELRQKYPFLSFLHTGDTVKDLEGFLFPDTYYFIPQERPIVIVGSFLDNFSHKAMPAYQSAKNPPALYAVVTIASLIQKEVRTPQDMKVVSGILWKRIANGMPLQVDSSLLYGTHKTVLSQNDLSAPSPYNTYLNKGLPPTPIANPGLNALTASLNPTTTAYWYYINTPQGTTVFSTTLQEQNQAISTYLH